MFTQEYFNVFPSKSKQWTFLSPVSWRTVQTTVSVYVFSFSVLNMCVTSVGSGNVCHNACGTGKGGFCSGWSKKDMGGAMRGKKEKSVNQSAVQKLSRLIHVCVTLCNAWWLSWLQDQHSPPVKAKRWCFLTPVDPWWSIIVEVNSKIHTSSAPAAGGTFCVCVLTV